MPRNPKTRRLAPSSVEAAPTPELGLQNFGRRLQQLLDQKGMNYSDLARAVWGKTTTRSGYEVARNRDRISKYVRGLQWPEPRNLKKIADELGVETSVLAPEIAGATVAEESHEVSMQTVAGHQDKTFLRIAKVVPMAVAVKIVAMLVDETLDDSSEPPTHPSKPPKIAHMSLEEDVAD
jgi:transcriptional regulator with XRE-family HTH domain